MYYLSLPFVYFKLQLKNIYLYILKYLLYSCLNIPFLKLNRIDFYTNTVYFDFVYINTKYKSLSVGKNKLVFSYFSTFVCDYYKKFLSKTLSEYDKGQVESKFLSSLNKSLVIEHANDSVVININAEQFAIQWLKHKKLNHYINQLDYSLLRTAVQSQKTKIELYNQQNLTF